MTRLGRIVLRAIGMAAIVELVALLLAALLAVRPVRLVAARAGRWPRSSWSMEDTGGAVLSSRRPGTCGCVRCPAGPEERAETRAPAAGGPRTAESGGAADDGRARGGPTGARRASVPGRRATGKVPAGKDRRPVTGRRGPVPRRQAGGTRRPGPWRRRGDPAGERQGDDRRRSRRRRLRQDHGRHAGRREGRPPTHGPARRAPAGDRQERIRRPPEGRGRPAGARPAPARPRRREPHLERRADRPPFTGDSIRPTLQARAIRRLGGRPPGRAGPSRATSAASARARTAPGSPPDPRGSGPCRG